MANRIGFEALSDISTLARIISVNTNIKAPIRAKNHPTNIIAVKKPIRNPAIDPSKDFPLSKGHLCLPNLRPIKAANMSLRTVMQITAICAYIPANLYSELYVNIIAEVANPSNRRFDAVISYISVGLLVLRITLFIK